MSGFAVALVVGCNPQEVLIRIRRAMSRNPRAAASLSSIRFERRPSRQYYVFLECLGTTSGSRVPQVVVDVVDCVQGLSLQSKDLISEVAIQPMTRGAVEVESFHFLSALWSIQLAIQSAIVRGGEDYETDDSTTNAEAYDKLLDWMSARRSGTFTELVNAMMAFGLTTWDAERQALRGRGVLPVLNELSALGHVDQDILRKRWSILSPYFAGFLEAASDWVLCGARTSGNMPIGFGQGTSRSFGSAPSTLVVKQNDIPIHHHPQSAIALLRQVTPACDWVNSLVRLPANAVRVDTRYERRLPGCPIRVLSTTGGSLHWAFANGEEFFVGEFGLVRAVGALQAGVVGGIDTESGTLILDVMSRPPGLVERALVAPSGRLPYRRHHRDTEVLVYSGVPAPVLDELSRIYGEHLGPIDVAGLALSG